MGGATPGLPITWANASLGDVTTKPQYGWTTKAADSGDKLKLLRTSDISSGRVNWHAVPTCLNEPQEPQKYFLKEGDIVVARAGSVGKSILIREDVTNAVFASYLVRFTPHISPEYIDFFMQSRRYWEQIEDKSSGIAIPNVNASKLSQLEIPVAPLNEQCRIVEKIETLFTRLDKGEEALRAVQVLLARYRQSVLKAAVTGQLTGGSTEDWNEVALGDLLEDIRYGTAKKCRPDVDGVAVLRIPNVVKGGIDLSDLKFTYLDDRERIKLELRKGDLLIVRSNGSANLVGRGAVVNDEAVGLAYAGYLIRLRVDQRRLLPDFLHMVLNSPIVRSRIERQARSTSGVHNINSREVKAITFELPPVEVQAEVIENVGLHFEKMSFLEGWCATELARSDALHQSILKDAFAGRLVPQDPCDEPATYLLARIKEARASVPRERRKPNA